MNEQKLSITDATVQQSIANLRNIRARVECMRFIIEQDKDHLLPDDYRVFLVDVSNIFAKTLKVLDSDNFLSDDPQTERLRQFVKDMDDVGNGIDGSMDHFYRLTHVKTQQDARAQDEQKGSAS